jgi:hypothetical protein
MVLTNSLSYVANNLSHVQLASRFIDQFTKATSRYYLTAKGRFVIIYDMMT